jgi:predicted SnoaL-like aldol condensation-catalyzing enzyme
MMIEEDDKVMTYSLLKFTPDHKGIRVVHILRFVDNQIVEMRDVAMQLA